MGFVYRPLIRWCGQAAGADKSGSMPVKVKRCPFHFHRTVFFWKCKMPQARSVLSLFFFSKFSVIQQWSLNNRVGTICSALMCKKCESPSVCWINIQIADTLSQGFFSAQSSRQSFLLIVVYILHFSSGLQSKALMCCADDRCRTVPSLFMWVICQVLRGFH